MICVGNHCTAAVETCWKTIGDFSNDIPVSVAGVVDSQEEGEFRGI
jgi:hypothetical protein